MQHWHIYQRWNQRLFNEMYKSYKENRGGKNVAKDPSLNWYEGEIKFFDHYVIPLSLKLKECGVFGVSSDEYYNYALENRREWKRKGKGIVTAMVDQYNRNNNNK